VRRVAGRVNGDILDDVISNWLAEHDTRSTSRDDERHTLRTYGWMIQRRDRSAVHGSVHEPLPPRPLRP
jgi:hypothetical protein